MSHKIESRFYTAVLLAAGLAVHGAGRLDAEPYRPTDDAQILEHLPGIWQADARVRHLRRLRTELSRDVNNLDLALEVAQSYVEIGRTEADPRYLGYAEAALAPWWEQAQPPHGVLFLRALVRQNRHDFGRALEDLDLLVRRHPRNAQAWLSRAVVQLVQGEATAAQQSCAPIRRTDPFLATACLATVGSHRGDAEYSYERLRWALMSFPGAAAENRLWALTGLAEIATRLGRAEAAQEHFEEALALGLRDIYLLAAYADFLLDQERPHEVLSLLEGETRADALLLRRALAAVRLATPRAKDLVAILDARFTESRLRGDGLHLGAESRFRLQLLGQPGQALRLALENWAIQREPVDARYVLEASLAVGDPQAAQPVLAWLAHAGLEDVRLTTLQRRIEEMPQ